MKRPRTNPALRAELARMIDEMTMQEYEPRTMTRTSLEPGERRESGGYRAEAFGIRASQGNYDVTLTPTVPNAPVWHELVQSFAVSVPAWKLRGFIRQGITGGRVSIWYRRAVEVARERLRRRAADVQAFGADQDSLRRDWTRQQAAIVPDPIIVDICRLAALNAAVRVMYQEEGIECPDDYSE